MSQSNTTVPDALLLLTAQCPHCATVLQGLGELVKNGQLGRLEVINIGVKPDLGAHYGARAVPWIRLGELELEGLHSTAELRRWAELAASAEGLARYYAELLGQGQLPRVLAAIQKYPQHVSALLALAEDPDTELTVRIGVSAVLEDLAGSAVLAERMPALLGLAQHPDPRVRADACHFLALSRSAEALAPLQQLTRDAEPSVQEVARDSLAELEQHLRG